ncbi:hypothetical protein SprV_0802625000 [Sparganum proliferum]
MIMCSVEELHGTGATADEIFKETYKMVSPFLLIFPAVSGVRPEKAAIQLILKDRQLEKERLANIFAYRTDLAKEFEKFKAQKARRREAAAKSEQVEIDRFDELFEELKDRKRFLDEMYELGRGREYAPMIETEISQARNGWLSYL